MVGLCLCLNGHGEGAAAPEYHFRFESDEIVLQCVFRHS